MKGKFAGRAVLVGAAVWSGAALAQDAGTVAEFGVGFDYSSGDYGAASDTTVFYVPFTARLRGDRWRADVTVPYLSLEGPGEFVGGGAVVPGGGGTNSRSGLGDVLLGGGFQLQRLEPGVTGIELAATAKLPTASNDLGTGEADFALAANIFHPATPQLTLTASGGYEWLGDPGAFTLEDGITASAGFYYAASQNVYPGAALGYRHSLQNGQDALVTLSPFISWRFAPAWVLTGYGYAGLTDSSPDYGMGLQFVIEN